MSWFGSSAAQAPPPPPQGQFGNGDVNPLTVAEIEVQCIQDMFNRMTRMCWKKCVTDVRNVSFPFYICTVFNTNIDIHLSNYACIYIVFHYLLPIFFV